MAEPILLPATALPGLLRAGLPCFDVVDQRHQVVVGIGADMRVAYDLGDEKMPGRGLYSDNRHVSVDLRDPAVRDAVCRWLWARLRPGEAEPLTAPAFLLHSADLPAHRVVVPAAAPRSVHFEPASQGNAFAVPALADVPLDDPDRDLHALRCVALAVGGAP